MGAGRRFMMTVKGPARLYVFAAFLAVIPQWCLAWQTLVLEPSLDNTLYESEPDLPPTQNELSNGKGIFLFAGRTGLDAGFRLRRAALQFDLSAIPAESEIIYAELTLFQSRAAPGSPPSQLTLHRLRGSWGEGNSDAAGPEGQGAFAEPGDVTWFNRDYPGTPWKLPGGDFVAQASAATTLGPDSMDFTWVCSADMLADLNDWLVSPGDNFGWLLRGFEDGAQNARRFHSREHSDAATRPRLKLVFRGPDELLMDGFEDAPTCIDEAP